MNPPADGPKIAMSPAAAARTVATQTSSGINANMAPSFLWAPGGTFFLPTHGSPVGVISLSAVVGGLHPINVTEIIDRLLARSRSPLLRKQVFKTVEVDGSVIPTGHPDRT